MRHITLSDYDYRNLIFSAMELAEYWISYLRIQETIGYRIKALIYQTFGYRTQKKLSVAHLWLMDKGEGEPGTISSGRDTRSIFYNQIRDHGLAISAAYYLIGRPPLVLDD